MGETNRKKHTGCLYEKNGYWQMRIFYYENGIRKPISRSTKLPVKGNKKRAQQMLDELLEEYSSATDKATASRDIGFFNYLMEWLEAYKSSIELNTYESYKDIMTRYIKGQPEETILLNELSPMHIQALYNRHIAQGLSPNTVLKLHANVRKALQYAYTVDILPHNPAAKVMLPKKKRFIGSFYNEDQVLNLLKLTQDEPMYPAILLAAFYGLRRSEILGLKWDAVDFKSGTLIIRDTVVMYKTVEDKEQTKTKSSYRTLPMTEDIVRYLKQLQTKQLENRLLLKDGYTKNNYVCKRENGEAFSPNYFTERFGKIIKKHQLPKLRFHDLRHSAASLLLANGFSLKEIQEYLGHGDIGTTSNIYGHLLFKAKQNMADSMGNTLRISG
ncbi:MAG TPA: site-specific integrase [Ruminococcaceae bacterium]|nr:site-specific integrase [Oscillospiraceae bacterium]HCA29247.1 site-specific integrase [Oscillospiraceae bacterium]